MQKNLNPVKERLLPLPESVELGQEKELNLTDFEDLNVLGSGSFATVYEATWRSKKQKIALKSLTKALIKKERNVLQVQREISLMYKLQHPNIIKFFTHFEDEEHIYLVMELATSGNLLEKLNKQEKGYFPEKQALKYILQIIKALKYLHSQNPPVLHRDLKPENVLLDKDGDCKLADFGSANQKLFAGTFCGTPLYMAPEMLLKGEYSKTLDIWSLGVLIFELLSGKPPFTVSQTLDKVDAQAVLSKNIIENALEFPKWFPTLAKDLLEKMLNKDPEKRPNIIEIEAHQWVKSLENSEGSFIEESRLRSRSLRYGYFAELQGQKRKKLNDILSELDTTAVEKKSQKLLEDLNKNFTNLCEQLNEMKVKFEVFNLKFERLSGFFSKISEKPAENLDSSDLFLQKIWNYKEIIAKKEELQAKLSRNSEELQKLEENCCDLELKILKSQSDYDTCVKNSEKVQVLEELNARLLEKKGEILSEIEEKSRFLKAKKSESSKENEKTEANGNKQDLLSHFFMKAQYFIREHKKISLLQDKKNSRYLEMKKEQRELEQTLAKKKEDLKKQIDSEFEETKLRVLNDFEREKQFLEEDFFAQKNQLEKKIQKMKLENYSLKTKVHINEETYRPRLEALKQLIEKYQENKMTLENIIGQKEKKLNELQEVLKDSQEFVEKKKHKGHKFAKFLYNSFASEKKEKKEKNKEKDKEKDRKSNQK